jgi:hypothetical protein
MGRWRIRRQFRDVLDQGVCRDRYR